MKTQKTKEQALLESLRDKLVMLKPHETYKGKYKVDLFYMEGYGELLFTIRSLLYLCISSIEHGDFETYSSDRNPKNNVQDVLELASRMIPIEEGDLLDKTFCKKSYSYSILVGLFNLRSPSTHLKSISIRLKLFLYLIPLFYTNRKMPLDLIF